jgi:predicted amidophosphoribosyltransferase
MSALATIARMLAAPLCAACGSACPADEVVCASCDRRLRASVPPSAGPPPGLDAIHSCAGHDGVARDLVRALKFGRLMTVAPLMAARMAQAPVGILGGALVPVPAAPLRLRSRGFDPAAEIALGLARVTGLPLSDCLRRRGSRRQVGRSRAQRLGEPPRIRLAAPPPHRAVLVDDVLTTGATLAACARELRRGGAGAVVAVTFARRL